METRSSTKSGEGTTETGPERQEGQRDHYTRVTVDRFYGEPNSDLEAWVFRIENIARLEGWNDERQLQQAIVALAGTALSEYRALATAPDRPAKMTWQLFLDMMRKRFGPNNPIAYWNQKLVAIRQSPTEMVAQYSGRFRHALGQLSSQRSGDQRQTLPAQTAVTWYHEGLLPSLQAELERDQPKTLQDAMDSALKAERVQRRLRHPRAAADADTYVNAVGRFQQQPVNETAQLRELIAKQGQMMERMMGCIQNLMSKETGQPQIPQSQPQMTQNARQPGGKFRGNCFRCNTPGHRAAECRKRWPVNQSSRPQQGDDGPTTSTGPTPQTDATPENRESSPTGGQRVMRVAVTSTESVRTLATTMTPEKYDTSHILKEDEGIAPLRKGISATTLVLEGVRPTTCVLDSGAEVSIVSEDLLESVGRNVDSDHIGARGNLVGASGATLPTVGTTQLGVSVGSNQLIHNFVVVKGFPYPVLLGTDFLSRVGAIIDFKSASVTLGEASDVDNQVQLPIRQIVTDRESDWLPELSGTSGRACVLTSSDPEPVVLDPTPDAADVTQTPQPGEQYKALSDDKQDTAISDGPSTAVANSKTDIEPEWKPSEKVTINEELDPDNKRRLCSLIDSYSDVFAANTQDMGRTWVATHSISTADSTPVNVQPYRVSPWERHEIDRQVEEMLSNGVIQESQAAWASPVVLSDKKDGTKRFCVDYRRLNDVTSKDRYPLPRVDDTLDLLGGQCCFTSLDLYSGYWQIPVSEEDRQKTAFITGSGLYEFNVMPFGLCNAPATFQRTMDAVLAGLKWQTCLVYLDDVLVFSKSFDERLEALFQRLRSANLKLKPGKCSFANRTVKFLGHLVSEDGVAPDPAAVTHLAAPTNKSQLRSFLGLASYSLGIPD